ncbi:MAG: LemA family protein [Gemmatimonadetes bacterium]|nr:LemA family protein [Gemmatimonadota bacterium]
MHTHRNRLAPVVLAIALFTSGCGYNRIQTLDEATSQSKQQISVQLQRRADLIPNLVEVVKGFAAQEAQVFETVAEARAKLAGAAASGDLAQMSAASQQMNGALGRLIAISESYPLLKSNENFLRLQDELAGTENRVAVARTDYNTTVNAYNAYIRKFPQLMTAKVMGMKAREYFELTNAAAAEVPKVDFAPPGGKTP